MCQTKVCTKCGIEKSLEEFAKSTTTKSGLKAACKPCKNIELTNHRHQNIGVTREKARLYAEKNRDKINEMQKQWRQNNPEKVQRHSQSRDKDKFKAYQKEYLLKNDAAIKERQKTYRGKNREKLNEHNKNMARINSAELHDSYVLKRLVSDGVLNRRDVPQELINLKRVEVMIKRQIKEMQNGK